MNSLARAVNVWNVTTAHKSIYDFARHAVHARIWLVFRGLAFSMATKWSRTKRDWLIWTFPQWCGAVQGIWWDYSHMQIINSLDAYYVYQMPESHYGVKIWYISRGVFTVCVGAKQEVAYLGGPCYSLKAHDVLLYCPHALKRLCEAWNCNLLSQYTIVNFSSML